MSKTRLLRFAIWASAVLTALFQTAFLFELHSPTPSDVVLWSLSMLTGLCVATMLLVRGSLVAETRGSYEPERPHRPRRNDGGAEYRVQAVYCIVLCQPSIDSATARTQCFYLSEGSADRAIATASMENPQWRAIGVEPPLRSDSPHATALTGHVA